MFSLWPMIVGHTAVVVAIFFTADVFRLARGQQTGIIVIIFVTRLTGVRDMMMSGVVSRLSQAQL